MLAMALSIASWQADNSIYFTTLRRQGPKLREADTSWLGRAGAGHQLP